MEIPIDEIRIAVLLITFLYASYLDIKSRRVPDNVWVPGLIVGLLIVGYEAFYFDPTTVVLEVGLSLGLIGLLAYLLFRFRIFYGADYKAFVFVALVAPVTPEILTFPEYGYDLGTVDPTVYLKGDLSIYLTNLNAHIATDLFGFTVLVNSSIFGIVYFFLNSYHNFQNDNFDFRRPVRSTCARKLDSTEVLDSHVQVIREVESDNFIFRGLEFVRNGIQGVSSEFYRDYLQWYRDQKFNSPDTEIEDLEEFDIESFSEDSEEWAIDSPEEDKEAAEILLRSDEVWVTPGIPYIVPITLGIIAGIFIGNIWYVILLGL